MHKRLKQTIMKRIIIISICLGAFFSLRAQPTINNLYNLDIGDKYYETQIEKAGSLTVDTGPDKSWNYHNVSGESIENYDFLCVNPGATPFADSASVSSSNIALKPINGSEGIYRFYKVTSNKCDLMAHANYKTGKTTFTNFYDPGTVLTFPFSYNSQFADNNIYWAYDYSKNAIVLKDTITSSSKAVGYGTIVTPVGTFSNALLVKSSNQQHLWLQGVATPVISQTTTYCWYVPGIKVPVFEITKFSGQPSDFVTYVNKTTFASGGISGGGGGGGDDTTHTNNPDETWRYVISSAGETYTKDVGELSWCLGEAVTETLNASSGIFTQGFCQPDEIITSIKENDFDAKIKVYPNPFSSEITIDISNYKNKLNGAIYSSSGQEIEAFEINEPVKHLQLNNYKPGVYYVRIIDDEKPRSFVIIKK